METPRGIAGKERVGVPGSSALRETGRSSYPSSELGKLGGCEPCGKRRRPQRVGRGENTFSAGRSVGKGGIGDGGGAARGAGEGRKR